MRNLRDAVSLLWEKAEDRITFKEASDMSDADVVACYLAKDLAVACDGLAALMCADTGRKDSSGWLQTSSDIQTLVRIFGDSFDTLAVMMELGQQARERKHTLMGLYDPETYTRMTQHAERQEVAKGPD